MQRYELSLSYDYVSSWTYLEAVREIFQNALDEETVNSKNKMFIEYDSEKQVLRIGNKEGVLDRKTLLLGVSSKRDEEKTIGKHGEGYKIASVVLLREGLGLKIYNYSKKEVWTAKCVKSRRYGTDIPAFDIEQYIFKSVPDHNLVFEISGFTKEMYNSVVTSNLHLIKKEFGESGLGRMYKTSSGDVLLDEKFKGCVFVNGLFVKKISNLVYGYNFAPSMLRLDRDRDLVDNFNLKWSIGGILRLVDDTEFLKEVLQTTDAEYLYSSSITSSLSSLSDAVTKEFFEKNGIDAIPCKSQDDFNRLVRDGYKPIMVSNNTLCAIKSSKCLGESVTKVLSLREQFSSWYKEIKGYLPEELLDKSDDLVMRVKSQLS